MWYSLHSVRICTVQVPENLRCHHRSADLRKKTNCLHKIWVCSPEDMMQRKIKLQDTVSIAWINLWDVCVSISVCVCSMSWSSPVAASHSFRGVICARAPGLALWPLTRAAAPGRLPQLCALCLIGWLLNWALSGGDRQQMERVTEPHSWIIMDNNTNDHDD